MKYVIGIDLGTSGVKVLLVDGEGTVLQSARAEYSPDFYDGGCVEQDPAVWWEGTLRALDRLFEENPGAAADTEAIAVSGQMHSSVFLDGSGEVIRPALLWNDTRTGRQVKEIYELAGGREKLLDMTCNIALEGFTLPKILWLKENEPENFARLDKVIMPKDYINYRLTGKVATDMSDAAGTLLFDVKKGEWAYELCSKTGIPTHILPKVLPSVGTVGKVSEDICERLGLNGDCVVICGGADNSCAAVGNGVLKPGQGVVSIGTSGTVIGFVDRIESEVDGGVHLFNYSVPDSYYAMGCMLCAGEALNLFKGTFLEDISFDEINRLGAEAPAGSGGLIFLPYIFGERSPHNDPNARGMFFGINGNTDKGCYIRSIMEGVGFAVRDLYEEVTRFTELKEVYITGGGAKSELWGQIISDILNIPLKVLNISEGPSYGAALIALAGSGIAESLESARGSHIKTVREFTPTENTVIYNRYYELFRRLYKSNKDNFAYLQNIL